MHYGAKDFPEEVKDVKDKYVKYRPKIYIDTRQRTADSASHSDFSVDLPTTLLMPEDTGFYVEDICIPVSWWSIEEGVKAFIPWSIWMGSYEAQQQSTYDFSLGLHRRRAWSRNCRDYDWGFRNC